MNNPLVNQAAMVLPVFLLSACLGGGGGSFDLDSVDTEAPRPAPKYQDVSSEKPQAQKDQGGYGFAMRLKRRNWYPQAKEDEVKLNESDWEATGLPTEPKKLPKRQKSVIDKVETDSDSNIYSSPYLTQSNHQNGNTGNGINQPKNQAKDYENFQYVYSGWFYKHAKREFNLRGEPKSAKTGDDGYIFYHGKEPSRQLPVSGTVTYKGVWHFATDTKKGQKFNDILGTSKGQGDKYSGFSGDDDEQYSNKNESMLKDGQEGYGFTSNLEVDFDNKKLTGKLIRNDRVTNATTSDKHTTQYYSLDATLKGNRFSGKAEATDKPKNGETKEHPFVSDSSSLSGGFFGPKGEELGFRFLSDDKKVAVVGSAKTQDKPGNGAAASGGAGAAASGGVAGTSSENSKLTTVLDAVELTHGGKAIKNLDNFSNAAQLVVDGIMIPLLPEASESGNNQANQGTNGGTAFTRKFDHTPNSDEKDTQAGTAANGDQAASNTAGDTNGKTKTYEVEVCCSNLNYLKYGLLTRKTAGNTVGSGNGSPTAAAQTAQGAQSMFLQGERTDEKEIPKEQQDIVYRGSWYGHIANGTSWSGNASDKEGGNRAEFTVNFADKKLNGTLTAGERTSPTFTITATIQGNGFEGTAKTGDDGFALDTKNTVDTHKAHITDANVQGGFYGPKAEELGGWFAYPGDRQAQPSASGSGTSAANSATVVFGAKRQQLVQ
ncbi:TPA: transferrin-binding protein-like solute binding protein [Neisseria meningitidis]